MSVNTLIHHCKAGSPTYIVHLLHAARAELAEMNWGGDYETVRERMLECTESCDRVEFIAVDNNRVVGCTVCAADDDIHVGPALSVMWNYVLPEYRGAVGRKFMKWAFRQAREWQLPVIAYTHRQGVGQYTTTYRQVRNRGVP